MAIDLPRTIFDLPLEVILHVADHIDNESILVLSRTCKTFNAIVDSKLYEDITITSFSQVRSLPLGLEGDPNRAAYIRTLYLKRVEYDMQRTQAITEVMLNLFKYRFKTLRKLVIGNGFLETMDYESKRALVDLILRQPAIEKLTIPDPGEEMVGRDYKSEGVRLTQLPTLKKLTLDSWCLHRVLQRAQFPTDLSSTRPFHLRLKECDHSVEQLYSLVFRVNNLTQFSCHHLRPYINPAHPEPEHGSRYFQALLPAVSTLTSLTILYETLWEPPVASLKAFENLKYVRTSTSILRTRGFERDGCAGWEELERRLPSGIETLALDPFIIEEQIEHEWRENSDPRVVQSFMEVKSEVVPRLKTLVIYWTHGLESDDWYSPDEWYNPASSPWLLDSDAVRAGIELQVRDDSEKYSTDLVHDDDW